MLITAAAATLWLKMFDTVSRFKKNDKMTDRAACFYILFLTVAPIKLLEGNPE